MGYVFIGLGMVLGGIVLLAGRPLS